MADGFDIQGAKKAGYSDAEIVDYLSKQNGYNAAGARQAGYSDEEILKHLTAEPPKSIGEQIGEAINTGVNYLGTQAAKVGSATLGLPRAIGDIANNVVDKLSDGDSKAKQQLTHLLPFANLGREVLSKAPSGGDIYGAFTKATGAPEVNSGIPALDAGVQGVIGTLATGGTSLPALVGGFGLGAGQEIAGDMPGVKGTAAEPYVRGGASVVGALTGHAVGSVPGKVVAAVRPFTSAGRDTLVGRTLNELADNPGAAIKNMEGYTPPAETPGFKLSAAKASKDDSLLATEEALSNPKSGFSALAKTNNAALSDALDRVVAGGDPKEFVAELAKQDTGAAMRVQAALDALPPGTDAATAGLTIQNALRGRYDALVGARKEATDPLYQAARESETPVNSFPLMSKTADLLETTKGAPQTTVANVRDLLFKNGQPDRTAGGMMATRDAIGDMLDNPMLPNYQKSLLTGFKKQAEDALSVIPEEQQARRTFARLSKPLEPFDANLGNKNAAAVISKDRFGKDFLMEPDVVPSRFFRPGEAGGASMREFFETRPTQEARDAMAEYIGQQARDAKDPQAFLKRYQSAIDTMPPDFGQRIRDIVTTGNIAKGFRSSPAGKFLNGDLDAAVKSTLGAPDSVKRMQALRMSVGGNPEAVAGLQKSVLDDFKKAASSSVQEDAAGNSTLQASGASRWLENNRAAITNALSPDQMRVLETVVRNLKDQAQTAAKAAGSNTGRNLATHSLLDAMLGPFRGAEFPGLAAIKKGLGFVYGGGDERTLERLIEVMQDPKIAAALMKKATPGNVKMFQPLLQSVTRGALLRTQGERGAQ